MALKTYAVRFMGYVDKPYHGADRRLEAKARDAYHHYDKQAALEDAGMFRSVMEATVVELWETFAGVWPAP